MEHGSSNVYLTPKAEQSRLLESTRTGCPKLVLGLTKKEIVFGLLVATTMVPIALYALRYSSREIRSPRPFLVLSDNSQILETPMLDMSWLNKTEARNSPELQINNPKEQLMPVIADVNTPVFVINDKVFTLKEIEARTPEYLEEVNKYNLTGFVNVR